MCFQCFGEGGCNMRVVLVRWLLHQARPTHLQFWGIEAAKTGAKASSKRLFVKQPTFSNYRLVTHFNFLIVGPDQNMVTKRP
jgi:hypothetical protein